MGKRRRDRDTSWEDGLKLERTFCGSSRVLSASRLTDGEEMR